MLRDVKGLPQGCTARKALPGTSSRALTSNKDWLEDEGAKMFSMCRAAVSMEMTNQSPLSHIQAFRDPLLPSLAGSSPRKGHKGPQETEI